MKYSEIAIWHFCCGFFHFYLNNFTRLHVKKNLFSWFDICCVFYVPMLFVCNVFKRGLPFSFCLNHHLKMSFCPLFYVLCFGFSFWLDKSKKLEVSWKLFFIWFYYLRYWTIFICSEKNIFYTTIFFIFICLRLFLSIFINFFVFFKNSSFFMAFSLFVNAIYSIDFSRVLVFPFFLIILYFFKKPWMKLTQKIAEKK